MSLDFDDLLDNSTKPTHEGVGKRLVIKKRAIKKIVLICMMLSS